MHLLFPSSPKPAYVLPTFNQFHISLMRTLDREGD
jgi:hypothetical protein